MKRGCGRLFLAVLLVVAALPAVADDLSGSDEILCSAVEATRCEIDDECKSGAPWHWNIPQFIVIDLDGKMLRTTKASGENRMTPIKNLERADGQILLQGAEAGRAFSFVINESTGRASIAVAAEGQAVVIFGACTTMPGGN